MGFKFYKWRGAREWRVASRVGLHVMQARAASSCTFDILNIDTVLGSSSWPSLSLLDLPALLINSYYVI